MKSKLLLLATITLFFAESAYAQSYNWSWTKAAGGNEYDRGYCIAVDAQGNSYMAGHFQSATMTIGSTTLTCTGQYDFFIAKYDFNGNVLWAKSGIDAGNDRGIGMTVDMQGNVLATGYFYGASIVFDNDTLWNANNGNGDFFIVKYDSNGSVLWAVSNGGAENDWGYGLACDASGAVYLSGAFGSASMTFGTSTITNATPGYEDLFVAKYDANGNPLWARSSGGSYWETGAAVALDTSANVYVTGYFYSSAIFFDNDTLNNTGGYDIFLAKYDSSGNALWATSAKGSNSEISTGLATDASGNVFISGSYYSDSLTFDTVMLRNTGAYDIFIAKYNAAGDVLWAKGFATADSGSDQGKSVATDNAGNVYLTGDFTGANLTIGGVTLMNPNPATRDLYVAKFNGSGNPLWAVNAGTLANEYSESVRVNRSGNYIYISGSFSSDTLAIGNDILYNNDTIGTTTDCLIAKLNILELSANTISATCAPLLIYPNPACGKISIRADERTAGSDLKIYNATGAIVYSDKMNGNEKTINCDLPAGIYHVQLSKGDAYYEGSFAVQDKQR